MLILSAKRLALALFIALATANSLLAQDRELVKVKVPIGIRYSLPWQATWNNFSLPFRTLTASKQDVEEFLKRVPTPATCGPKLWSYLVAQSGKKLDKVGSARRFVTLKDGRPFNLGGRSFWDRSSREVFAQSLFTLLGEPKQRRVRQPNENEVRAYWDMVNYDLHGPIYVVESGGRTILIDGGRFGYAFFELLSAPKPKPPSL